MGAQWKQKGREANSAAKGKLLSKAAKEVLIAAKGGADPASNVKLRIAIEFAKKVNMTRDTLERVIKKGSGQLDETVNYELVTYEGFGPGRVPVVVECLTDNRTRTAANVRGHFREYQIAATGAVTWDFSRLGAIGAKGPTEADAEAAAIEAGAQDFEKADDGSATFYTDPQDLDAVRKLLETAGWTIESAALVWKAKNPVTVAPENREELEEFLATLDDDDDVQTLFVGIK